MSARNIYLPISQVGPKGPPTLVEQFQEYKELTVSDIPSDTVCTLGQCQFSASLNWFKLDGRPFGQSNMHHMHLISVVYQRPKDSAKAQVFQSLIVLWLQPQKF